MSKLPFLLFLLLPFIGTVDRYTSSKQQKCSVKEKTDGKTVTLEFYFRTFEELQDALEKHPTIQKYASTKGCGGKTMQATLTKISTEIASTMSAPRDGTSTKDKATTHLPTTPQKVLKTIAATRDSSTTPKQSTTQPYATSRASKTSGPATGPQTTPAKTQFVTTIPTGTQGTEVHPTFIQYKSDSTTPKQTTRQLYRTSRPATPSDPVTSPQTTPVERPIVSTTPTDCDVFHDGKCFKFHISTFQDVTLASAEEKCGMLNSQLGNIYNEEHYSEIKEYLRENAPGSVTLWTGMTFNPETSNIFSSAGENIGWDEYPWYEGYPETGDKRKKKIAIKVQKIGAIVKGVGVMNTQESQSGSDEKLHGAFCEQSD